MHRRCCDLVLCRPRARPYSANSRPETQGLGRTKGRSRSLQALHVPVVARCVKIKCGATATDRRRIRAYVAVLPHYAQPTAAMTTPGPVRRVAHSAMPVAEFTVSRLRYRHGRTRHSLILLASARG